MLEKINHKIVPKEVVNALINLYHQGEFLQILEKEKQFESLYQDSIEVLNIFGSTNLALKNCKRAIINFNKAIKINPNISTIYYNLGLAYHHIGNMDDAIVNYKKAIDLKPDYDEALNNMGMSLEEKGDVVEAIDKYNKVLEINTKHAGAYYNLGNAFILCGDYNSAIKYYKQAVLLDQERNNFFEALLFASNYSPDMSAEEIFAYYKQYDQRFGFPHKHKWKIFTQPKIPKNKLKIGYVSPDFQKHSVQNFLLPTLAHHNHKEFEIFAFAELEKEDKVSQEYKSYVDHWIRTDRMTDDELAQKIGDLGIDILVDLAGHTRNNRLTVFAQKPAPISVTWLGYGYTTGLSAIDYFLTDKFVTPKGSEHLFLEKPWQLKNHTYCCYKAQENMDKVTPLPALSNGFITFGTISKNLRINNNLISIWSIILKRVNKSKLLINNFDLNSHHSKEILISRFKAHGISENRLDFYYETPPWNSMHQIDIALDCFPHNSGTTLFEHLYMGNPFITYSSRPSVGKIGTSILSTLGHPEWIATSEEEYVDKAVTLASDPLKLSIIRQNLRTEMEASPLMDQKGFVRELEEAYQAMWKKWCST